MRDVRKASGKVSYLFYLQTYLDKIFNTVTLENYAYDPVEKKTTFALMHILQFCSHNDCR
jgi:hypothetical protein